VQAETRLEAYRAAWREQRRPPTSLANRRRRRHDGGQIFMLR